MRMLYLDFETYYSTEYSLRGMDPPSYILDPRFELIMCGVAFDDEPVRIIDGPDVEAFFKSLDPNEIATVSHNAQFDASILSWRYDWRPKLICDTLSLSRTIIANKLKSHSLGKVAEYLGLPQKGTAVADVKGMSRADIIANGMWPAYTAYCAGDTELCREIFKALAPELPNEEFVVHDLVLRMAVDPVLHGDVTVLAEHLAEVQARKELIFARAMTLDVINNKSDLMSNEKLAAALMRLGVEPPRKPSPATGLMTWAFDKRDEGFQELREHESPYVRDLVEARLGYKSTIEETRCARLLNIAQLEFPHHGANMLPVALRIGGARTHRLSGDWKCNFQNLGRASKIRQGLVAPPGNSLLSADSAQIEARILAWYCAEKDIVEAFWSGADVYADFASRLFGYPVTKESHPIERFVGKQGVLGCGYMCGPLKFLSMIRSKAAIEGFELKFDEEDAKRVVQGYRDINKYIKQKWDWLATNALPHLAHNDEYFVDGPVKYRQYEVTGPSNLKMFYPRLRRIEGQWVYDDAGQINKLYGGKLIENIVQHMARVFIMEVALEINRIVDEGMRVRLVLQSHDELVYCCPNDYVEILRGLLHGAMTTPPKWASNLPLATEVKVGPNYGDMSA